MAVKDRKNGGLSGRTTDGREWHARRSYKSMTDTGVVPRLQAEWQVRVDGALIGSLPVLSGGDLSLESVQRAIRQLLLEHGILPAPKDSLRASARAS